MKSQVKNQIRKYALRWGIIFFSILFLCSWVERKEGYHMDEMLSYEFANAEYNPWIVPTQPQGRLAKFWNEYIDGDSLFQIANNIVYILNDTLENQGNSILMTYTADVYDAPVWVSRGTFQDYITVDEDDDFNLFSVYFNVKDDTHPPLFYMILHLACSIFKREMSPWTGCGINIIFMAVSMWYLGEASEQLGLGETSILATMVWFGFSTGIVATTLWIRMYGLLALWIVCTLYLHLKLWNQKCFVRISKKNGRAKLCGNLGLFWLALLIFWTQYFGLFFLMPLAAVTVIGLWKADRIQEMWAYVRTMILAAVVGVTLFPFAISHVLLGDRGQEVLAEWSSGIMEYFRRIGAFGQILGENVTGSGWVLLLMILIHVICFIFRKVKCTVPLMMLLIPTLVYFLLAAKVSPFLVERYLMPIFPSTVLVIVFLWDNVWKHLRKSTLINENVKKVFMDFGIPALAVLLVILQMFEREGTHTYLYSGYEKQVELAEKYNNYPLVCLYEGVSFYENLVEMEYYEQTMLVQPSELDDMDKERCSVTEQGYVLLVKDAGSNNGEEQVKQVMDVFGGNRAELLLSGESRGDVLYLIMP